MANRPVETEVRYDLDEESISRFQRGVREQHPGEERELDYLGSAQLTPSGPEEEGAWSHYFGKAGAPPFYSVRESPDDSLVYDDPVHELPVGLAADEPRG